MREQMTALRLQRKFPPQVSASTVGTGPLFNGRHPTTTMSSQFPHLLGASLLALTTLLVGCASSPKLPPLRTVPFSLCASQ